MALRSGPQIDEPETLTAHLAAKHDDVATVAPEDYTPRPSREDERRQRIRPSVRSDGTDREGGAHIRARIKQELAIRRPDRIQRIFRDQRARCSAIHGNLRQARLTVMDGCRSDRFPVRRPGRVATERQGVCHHSGLSPIAVHYPQRRTFSVRRRESNPATIGGD